MKKITTLLHSCVVAFATVAISLSLFSCQGVASFTIEKIIEQANAECPMYIDEDIVCDRIYISGSNVIYNYQTSPDIVEGILLLGDTAKQFLFDDLQSMAATDKDLRTMIDLCVEAKYNIVYKYNDNMGYSARVSISYHELANI